MKIYRLFGLIPREQRTGWLLVIVSGIVRTLLDLVGLAALIALLPLIMSPDGIAGNKWVSWIYTSFGFASEATFIWAACGTIVAVTALKGFLNLLIARYQNRYLMSLYRYFSRRMLDSYYRRGLLFVKEHNSAQMAYEVNNVSMCYVQGVLMGTASLVSDILLTALMFTAITLYDPAAALMVFALFVPLIFIYIQSVRGRLLDFGRLENKAHRRQSRVVQEIFRGYPEVEVNNAFPFMEREFDEGLKTVSRLRQTILTIQRTPEIIIETGIALALAALVLLKTDAMLLGVFGVVALRMLPTVRNIINTWIVLRNSRFAEETVAKAITGDGSSPTPCTGHTSERLQFRESIVADNVSFSFGRGEPPVIEGLSLEIRKGERLGIKGVSGVGKSTLFNLLLGLYPPSLGQILVDRVPVSGENRRRWQNIVGYVPQEVFVMDGTVAENVAFGSEADREKIGRALAAARLGGFVAGLPEGVDTRIGEGGSRLSGGQKQRLGIARALYKDAEVLFFDEATSSLDSQTEREINDALRELSETRAELTIIVIAHRESSLAFCDRIIEIGR